MVVTCGNPESGIRSQLETETGQQCHLATALAKDQSTAESTERKEVCKALRNADTAATTAQRELAIRNSVVSIQSGSATPESEALRICCSTYEFALKYSHPGADPEFAALACEAQLGKKDRTQALH